MSNTSESFNMKYLLGTHWWTNSHLQSTLAKVLLANTAPGGHDSLCPKKQCVIGLHKYNINGSLFESDQLRTIFHSMRYGHPWTFSTNIEPVKISHR